MASQFESSSRSHLPTWNRTGLCRNSGTDVRKLARDGFTPSRDGLSPVIESTEQLQCTSGSMPKGRVIQLEKNMIFLMQQHHDTLEQLHKEIEKLKKVNRELNFKLVMCCCGRQEDTTETLPKEVILTQWPVQPATPSSEQPYSLYMPEDMQRLKNSLATERSKSNPLLRFTEKKLLLERQKSLSLDVYDSGSTLKGGVQQSCRVGGSVATHARISVLDECEAVIQCLERKNSQQAHELLQIKADLRDVLHSHKWTPDAFLIARAYVSKDSQGRSTISQGLLPQVPVTSRPEKAYRHVKEEVTLPYLKPKFSHVGTDRNRRAHAIRGRTSKGIL